MPHRGERDPCAEQRAAEDLRTNLGKGAHMGSTGVEGLYGGVEWSSCVLCF